MVIKVNAEEIKQCYDFACHAWNQQSQSQRNFGTDPRTKNQFVADQVAGKLSEIIFKKFIQSSYDDLKVEVNFEHYSDMLDTDDGDVILFRDDIELPVRIDIKGSSHRAQWLVVEDYKYCYRETGEKVSDVYVMVKFGEDMPMSGELRANPEQLLDKDEIGGDVVGWVRHEELDCPHDQQPWFVYERGDRFINARLLPKNPEAITDRKHLNNYIRYVANQNPNIAQQVGPVLQAVLNIGLPIKWLNLNVEELINA